MSLGGSSTGRRIAELQGSALPQPTIFTSPPTARPPLTPLQTQPAALPPAAQQESAPFSRDDRREGRATSHSPRSPTAQSPRVRASYSSPFTYPYSLPQTVSTDAWSPSLRRGLSRPLSPDLPDRDALYLFANFGSYMRSPDEGSTGIHNSDDFRDTIRLLDYARYLAAKPHSNVHVLHMKYRFHDAAHADVAIDDHDERQPGELAAKRRLAVPPPFSTLHDPVIRLEYLPDGRFDPLPAQAVFSHIAKSCRPPPRVIVVSYVQSIVTSNHLASISSWALASSPPCAIFSPLETRLREYQPLEDALYHAIPISMYAWPTETASPLTATQSPVSGADPKRELHSKSTDRAAAAAAAAARPGRPAIRTVSAGNSPIASPGQISPSDSIHQNSAPRVYPNDPVASLTVITADSSEAGNVASGMRDPDAPADRIPLWALAPGVGVLHGSTSASLGVKLSDFSAINLCKQDANGEVANLPNQQINPAAAGIKTSRIDPRKLTNAAAAAAASKRPPVEPPTRTGTATPEPITRPGSAASSTRLSKVAEPQQQAPTSKAQGGAVQRSWTGVTHLTPDDSRPASLPTRTQSWPGKASKVPGWRRGRTEVMEDALEEMSLIPNEDLGSALAARMRNLDLQPLSAAGEDGSPQDEHHSRLLPRLAPGVVQTGQS